MDYSKIRLKNERSTHVTKRRNRLGAFGFFKVLYRDNLWRLLGFSLLMLVCIAPIYVMQILGSMELSNLNQTLPNLNGFGFSTGVWNGLDEYFAKQSADNNLKYGMASIAVSMLGFLVLSGGFAVIRDGFWTGKLSTVGVFKSLGKGIAANAPYALVTMVVVSFGVFGIISFFKFMAETILWLAIVLTVLMSLVLLLVVCYLLILCSVSVTYKQSIKENLDDSWRLLWMNFLPNIIHLVIALLPIPLYFLFAGGALQILFLVFVVMFGGLYFPLVWHSFMMRTFALFHPVEPKKKKDFEREERERQQAIVEARIAAKEKRAAKKGKKDTSDSDVELHAAPAENNGETVAVETVDETTESNVAERAAADEAADNVADTVAESTSEEVSEPTNAAEQDGATHDSTNEE